MNLNRTSQHAFLIIPALCLSLSLSSCQRSDSGKAEGQKPEQQNKQVADIDFSKIRARGYITAIMYNSSTSLFLYKGQPMGYEYELLSIFADSVGLELRFHITPNIEEAFDKLNRGEGDILAYKLTVTKERRKRISFTDYHNVVRQVLVQRKPDNWRSMKLHEIENTLIRTPIELIAKEIHVRRGSAYVSRLANLADEIGGDILVVEEASDVDTEDIIRRVANGEFDYAVADEDIALVNARYYPNIDIKTPVSLPQQIAWGLRKHADTLRRVLNDWIYTMKRQPEYYTIYDKYFRSTHQSKSRLKSDFYSAGGGHISPYDSLIKAGAAEIGWDWRLLAAQIAQESAFDPAAESWVGAIGLMQLLPVTGADYGAENLLDPVQNIRAGTNYLKWIQKNWQRRVPDSLERRKFVLASYNVGLGHVKDAVRLAKKNGLDTAAWHDNVAKYLLLKSKPQYYEDSVVKHGYCRGQEPVDYVEKIMKRYQEYLQLVGV